MDNFDTQVQVEELNFWEGLAEIIASLSKEEQEEILSEINPN
jgi:hypothetical protein